jgi:hypothetical protein
MEDEAWIRPEICEMVMMNRILEAHNPVVTGRHNRERTIAMIKNEYLNQEQMKPSQAEEGHEVEKLKGGKKK